MDPFSVRTQRFSKRWSGFVETQRLRLANVEALPQLSVLGIVCGALSGTVILLFRFSVEASQEFILPGGVEAFETLPMLGRIALPLTGGILIGALIYFTPKAARHIGVTHVIERLDYHQGYLPFRNAVLQFFGAAICIICGHSVGREGPSVHLGAASGSLLAQRLGLPNNSVRILVGCGIAAAIAAGFNTPLAGVIFAMEVVLMEYTITGFAPIILAAVSATTLTRLVYGNEVAFFVPPMQWTSVAELPYVLLMGIAIGGLAAIFIHLLMWINRVSDPVPDWLRAICAGAAVGLVALWIPEIMGIGYDTVNAALLGELSLVTLLVFVAAKLIASTLALGLGLPGGLIAPTLVLGAAAGGSAGVLTVFISGSDVSHGFYAMLGMGAMMAATLQAPLAALIALLELTANPNIIMPGMIAVIAAMLVTRVGFRLPSIYQLIIQARGRDYQDDPLQQALRRIGVASVMDKAIGRENRVLSRVAAQNALSSQPNWIVVRENNIALAMLPAADLARYLEEHPQSEQIDLLEIPAQRRDLERTTIVATVQEAKQILLNSGKDALYVTGAQGAGLNKIYGVLTRGMIERSYTT